MGYSKELMEKTKRNIEEPDLRSFMVDNRCHLKRLEEPKFGYLKVEDALNCRFVVHVRKSEDNPLEYRTVDELVADGWVAV